MFQFLDHPSESLIQVNAATMEEVFVDAARALFELMTDISQLKNEEQFRVMLESTEKHFLMIDWLNHLIYLHEVQHIFLCSFSVKIEHQQTWALHAEVGGEKIRENHERRLHAKSATYGQFEWKETEVGHEVRFVIDI